MKEKDDVFFDIILWSPATIYFIIFLYQIFKKGSIGMIEWQTSVSYTHLDVYKRQVI